MNLYVKRKFEQKVWMKAACTTSLVIVMSRSNGVCKFYCSLLLSSVANGNAHTRLGARIPSVLAEVLEVPQSGVSNLYGSVHV